MDEIIAWGSATDDRKRDIWRAIARRRKAGIEVVTDGTTNGTTNGANFGGTDSAVDHPSFPAADKGLQ